ncbi:hypothetical protein BKA60DRAFT_577268 [Fusarium oxysporum]|nr:hypothetical protein BKA60DRAFT_577268 [Fusarium oxysporum]
MFAGEGTVSFSRIGLSCKPFIPIHLITMVQLSTDAIVTIISTIPGLLILCLSAWFAYAALRRRHVNRNDIETATIEFIIAQISATPLSLELPYTHQFAPEVLLPSENLPQLTPPTHHNIRGRKQRQTETLLPPRFDR